MLCTYANTIEVISIYLKHKSYYDLDLLNGDVALKNSAFGKTLFIYNRTWQTFLSISLMIFLFVMFVEAGNSALPNFGLNTLSTIIIICLYGVSLFSLYAIAVLTTLIGETEKAKSQFKVFKKENRLNFPLKLSGDK